MSEPWSAEERERRATLNAVAARLLAELQGAREDLAPGLRRALGIVLTEGGLEDGEVLELRESIATPGE